MKGYLKEIATQTLVWSFAVLFFVALRQYGQELVDGPAPRGILEHAFIYLSTGLVSAITFVSFDRVFTKGLKSIKSFGMTILVRSMLYLVIFVIIVVFGTILFMLPSKETMSIDTVFSYLLSGEGVLTLSYLFIVSFLIQFVKQVDKKFGPGNLIRMLKGEFHTPKEVERIVMFLDLKSSTTIAEKIGHIRYSLLIQDCFDELDITRSFQAEIYQYVGDEVVLIWEPKKGLNNANCIKLYYSFNESLLNKSEYFESTYGVVPKFKCGCHIGKVVMTEIGQIKREIAFHGDVMNTAARIQSQCNKHGKDYLLSETLYGLLSEHTAINFNYIDTVNLKGKTTDVKLYSVENINGE